MGIKAIKIADNDELISVRQTDLHQELIIATRNGMGVRFKGPDVRPMGCFVGGVRGVNLSGDD